MPKKTKTSSCKYLPELMAKLLGDSEYVWWNGHKLRTAYIADIMDMFLSRYYQFGKRKSNLHSEYLRKQYGTHYNHYLGFLMAHGVIGLSSNYLVGEKSKTYELLHHWCHDETITAVPVLLPVKQKGKEHKTRLESPIEEHIREKMGKDLQFISIVPDAIEWLQERRQGMTHRSWWKNVFSCRKLLEHDLHKSFDRYGRMHTNITVLKRDIRKRFLQLDGQHVLEIDITNSQPFFLFLHMSKAGFTDWDGFDHDVLNEIVYDRMLHEGGFASRDAAKEAMYKVLFGRNPQDKANKAFRRMYPSVWARIVAMKAEARSHRFVAHTLQRLESAFIYNTVVARIMEELPDAKLLTVHDSVLCTPEYYERVKTIFEIAQHELLTKNISELSN